MQQCLEAVVRIGPVVLGIRQDQEEVPVQEGSSWRAGSEGGCTVPDQCVAPLPDGQCPSVLHVPITSLNPSVSVALSVCLSWLGRSRSSALPKELNYGHTTSPASAFSYSFETCE